LQRPQLQAHSGYRNVIVDILEGESLINDASALLALEFGIALLVGGLHTDPQLGLLRLFVI